VAEGGKNGGWDSGCEQAGVGSEAVGGHGGGRGRHGGAVVRTVGQTSGAHTVL
jgi:hypothetical protein